MTTRLLPVPDLNDLSHLAAIRTDMSVLQEVMRNLPGFIWRRRMLPGGAVQSAYVSPSIWQTLGFASAPPAITDPVIQLMVQEDFPRVYAELQMSAQALRPYNVEFRLRGADGIPHWFRSEASPVRLADGSTVWDGISIKITARQLAEGQTSHHAFYDTLTGLPRRELFLASLGHLLESATGADEDVAIMVLDVGGIDAASETHGFDLGAKILRRVSFRLAELARPRGGHVAKLSAGLFALAIPKIGRQQALMLANAVCAAAIRPVEVEEAAFHITITLGAALADDVTGHVSDRAAAALDAASSALDQAKSLGIGRMGWFQPRATANGLGHRDLRRRLEDAIAARRFVMHYQPICDLNENRLAGAEALLRWTDPEDGPQAPSTFIELAERTGLIAPLGVLSLRMAFRQCAHWAADGETPIRVAVNVSTAQLQQPGFLNVVRDLLADTGADPRLIDLELTETAVLHITPQLRSDLTQLRTMGFGLSMDDFGSGFTSLQVLRDLPFDKVKIDKVFVGNIDRGTRDLSILRAVMSLARGIGMDVVAEGVETRRQRAILREEGCRFGQGYLIGRPMPAADLPLPQAPAPRR